MKNTAKFPVIGQNPNAEEVASFHPDLVFMKGVAEDERSQILEEFGIKVIYLGLETPELYMQDIKNIGLALGNSERADEIITYYQGKLDGNCQYNVGNWGRMTKRTSSCWSTVTGVEKLQLQVPAASWMQTLEVQMAER